MVHEWDPRPDLRVQSSAKRADRLDEYGRAGELIDQSSDVGPAGEGQSSSSSLRLRACVEAWPGCFTGGYHPSCCRFPKSCSATVYSEEHLTPDELERIPALVDHSSSQIGSGPGGWSEERIRRARLPWDHPESCPADGMRLIAERDWATRREVGGGYAAWGRPDGPDDLWPEGADQDWQTAILFGEMIAALFVEGRDWVRDRWRCLACWAGVHRQGCGCSPLGRR